MTSFHMLNRRVRSVLYFIPTFIGQFFIIILFLIFYTSHYYFLIKKLYELGFLIISWLQMFLSVATVFMFYYCWIYTMVTDAGSIKNDLIMKGLWRRIVNGDIPDNMISLPICYKCNVPKPGGSYHCDYCDTCYLRHDHHCVFLGNCIADKNFKSFILSFFYASIFCFNVGVTSLFYMIFVNEDLMIPVFIFSYSSIFGGVILCFCISFIYDSNIPGLNNDRISFLEKIKIILPTFGSSLTEYLIPVQKTSSYLAWYDTRFNSLI